MAQTLVEKEETIQLQQQQTIQKPHIALISQGCGTLIYSTSKGTVLKCSRHVKTNMRQDNELDSENSEVKIYLHSKACLNLQNDFKIVRQFSHINVVQYICYRQDVKNLIHQDSDEPCCAILMKQYKEDFFDKFLDDGKNKTNLDINQYKRLFKGIIQGLAHIHEKNYAHNDLKPENIFYEDQQEIGIIGDFGFARNTQDKSYTFEKQKEFWAHRCLTYAGPEIFTLRENQSKNEYLQTCQEYFGFESSQEVLDEQKNDIFAMGQMIFLIITGSLPRVKKMPDAKCPIYKLIITGQKEKFFQHALKNSNRDILWNDLKDLCDLTVKMMSLIPKNRPSCEEILKDKFFDIDNGQNKY